MYRPAQGPTRYPEYQGSTPGVKRPGREADNTPPCSAEVKHEWSYTPTPTIYLHGTGSENFYQMLATGEADGWGQGRFGILQKTVSAHTENVILVTRSYNS